MFVVGSVTVPTGTALGALVGGFIKTPRWRRVELRDGEAGRLEGGFYVAPSPTTACGPG